MVYGAIPYTICNAPTLVTLAPSVGAFSCMR